jgi:hypothetical protein
VERLVEKKQPSSPEEARLTDLVAAHERTSLSDATKDDVFTRVLARRPYRARTLPMLRPALVFGILLAAGATTAATLGHRWIAEKLHLGAEAQPAAPAVLPAPATRRHEPRVAAPQPLVPEVEAPEVEAPIVPLPAPEAAPSKHGRPHAARSEDPSRIVAAIQALRTEHDPDRAARLVAEYLKVYPQGALAEEALALSIEAAAARHNPAAASAFAEQYLKRYPNGRFSRAAEQARRASGP